MIGAKNYVPRNELFNICHITIAQRQQLSLHKKLSLLATNVFGNFRIEDEKNFLSGL